MKNKVFQMSKGRRSVKGPDPKTGVHQVKRAEANDEPPIQPVQGKMPQSVIEWRVALALMKLRVDFMFQVPLAGGRRVRGGQVIDFMVYAGALPTPVWVHGDYWHQNSRMEDRLNADQVKRIYHGQVNEPVFLWEHELQSVQAAFETVRRELIGK